MCKYINIIVQNKLGIERLKAHFKDSKSFEIKDIAIFYKKYEPEINRSTVNFRVYTLVQKGVISRIGRGKFILGERKKFVPEISPEMKDIYKKIQKKFPYLTACVWSTSAFNEFMLHQAGHFYMLIEVEKEATHSVFYFLKESNYPVFVEPTSDLLEKYIGNEKETLIVKPLVSEAPTMIESDVNTATLEKMLVDIFCDDVLFSTQQGAEMRMIFKEAWHKYAINQNRMFRYASRRRKKEEFDDYLNSMTDIKQQ